MNRILLCALLAVGWFAVRATPIKPPVAPAIPGVSDQFSQLSSADRKALSETYAILARTVDADPESDPVFVDLSDVRRAHRAALLAVWRGVLGNQPGKYPGLREALEGFVDRNIGSADVIASPPVKKSVAETFRQLSASLQ